MSKKDEALKLALEALDESLGYVEEEAENAQRLYGQYPTRQARIQGLKDDARKHMDAITAIREALAERLAQGCEFCSHPLYAGTKCKHCGREQQQEPVGAVYRYGKDSSGKPWHGTLWTASGLDLPDGTLIYTSPPAQQQEPVSLKSLAQKAGINLPETYIPTMDDAIAAGDSVLMNEQAALLRECRAALDSLIAQKPTLAGLLCGSTTLGNLKAELGAYRPQGVFGTSPPASKPLTDEQIKKMWSLFAPNIGAPFEFARAIEAAHGIKEDA